MEITQLTDNRSIESAGTLLAKQIPDVIRSHIGGETDSDTLACKAWLRESVSPYVGPGEATMLPHIWVGAYERATLVGAVHLAPLATEAREHFTGYLAGRRGMGEPPWVLRLLNTTARVEELAVRPEHRGKGVGLGLLVEAHRLLRQYRHPVFPLQSVSSFVSSTGMPTFKTAGYTFAKPRTPVPAEFVGDMPTMWDAAYDSRDGAFCYGHIDDLM